MATKTVKRSISMSQEMHDLLLQVVAKRGREVKEVDVIRDAIRQYLDEQEAVIGSRRHFQKTLQARLDRLEATVTFHLNILLYLLATVLPDESERAIEDAIIAARRNGQLLQEQITAVREMDNRT